MLKNEVGCRKDLKIKAPAYLEVVQRAVEAHSCSRGLVVRKAVKPDESVALVSPSGLL
jgi:hypothetical protein